MPQYPIRPDAINFEITNLCNLRCPTCLRENMTYHKGLMSVKLYERLVKEAGHLGVPKLRLHWRGEPMLHSKWAWMVKCAKDAGIRNVVLFTNSTVLNQRNRQAVFDSGLDEIHFSLNGFSPKVFELVRNGASYDKVINYIHSFLVERRWRNSHIIVVLRYIKMDMNKHEVEDFCKYWEPMVNDIIITDDMRNDIFSKDISINNNSQRNQTICHDLSRKIFVSWDGRVFPCFVSWNGELFLGDANTQTLSEIWQGTKLSNLRNLHEQNKRHTIPLCAHCTVDQCDIFSLRRGHLRRVGV